MALSLVNFNKTVARWVNSLDHFVLAWVLENLPAEDLGERRSVPGPGIEPTHLPSSSDDDDRSTIEPLILREKKFKYK